MTAPTNGKLTWWILGLLSTVSVGLTSAWTNTLQTRIEKIEDSAGSRIERSAALEAEFGTYKQRFDRLESKLDKLLEAVRHGNTR